MSVQYIKSKAGDWLFVVTDQMGELVHSEGMFPTKELAEQKAKKVVD